MTFSGDRAGGEAVGKHTHGYFILAWEHISLQDAAVLWCLGASRHPLAHYSHTVRLLRKYNLFVSERETSRKASELSTCSEGDRGPFFLPSTEL